MPAKVRSHPTPSASPFGDERLLSKGEVLDLVGKSFVTLWSWMRSNPPKFPLPRIVHGQSMWLHSEVIAWMHALPKRQYKRGDADA
jgi:predicted DNA-binding transcriptional regulator AlpA